MKRAPLFFCASLLAFFLFTGHFLFPEKSIPTFSSKTKFYPQKIKQIATPFEELWLIETKAFHPLSYTKVNFTTKASSPFPTSSTITLEGELEQDAKGRLWMQKATFQESSKLPSLAYLRWQFKEYFRKKVQANLGSTLSGSLFSALITGECDDRYLAFIMGETGVLHLLAISGFHLHLLAFFLTRPLLFFLADFEKSERFVFFALLAYFLFIGGAPPIFRATVMVAGSIISRRFGFFPAPLNLLGAAALLEMLLDPSALFEMGFELSYSATLALMILAPSVDRMVQAFAPPPLDLHQSSIFKKILRLLSSSIRKMVALNMAVHLVSIPLLVHHMGHFSTLSFLYNLYIPILFPPVMALSLLFCLPLFGAEKIFLWGANLLANPMLSSLESFPRSEGFLATKPIALSCCFVLFFMALCKFHQLKVFKIKKIFGVFLLLFKRLQKTALRLNLGGALKKP